MKKLLLGCFLLASYSAAMAQYYSAPTEIIYPNRQVVNNDIASINNKIVTFIDGTQGPGYYTYDTVTKTEERLAPLQPSNLHGGTLLTHFTKLGDRLFLDALGKLYVTDGTQSGTTFLKDFGVNSFPGSASSDNSRITNLERASDVVYVTKSPPNGAEGFDDNNQVWRLSLSGNESRLISSISSQSFNVIEGSSSGSSVLVFGYDDEIGWSFWRASNASDELNLLAQFTGPEERALGVFKGLHTEAGFIFCRNEFSIERGQSMWRLADDGQLTRLREGCEKIYSANKGDAARFYYLTETSFGKGDGTTQGSNSDLLFPDPGSEFSTDRDVCFIGDEIFATQRDRDGTLIFDLKTKSRKRMPGIVIEQCLANFVILRDTHSRSPHNISVYQKEDRQTLRVRAEIFASQFSTSTSLELRNQIYFFKPALFDAGSSGELIITPSKLFRLEQRTLKMTGFVPAILSVLED